MAQPVNSFFSALNTECKLRVSHRLIIEVSNENSQSPLPEGDVCGYGLPMQIHLLPWAFLNQEVAPVSNISWGQIQIRKCLWDSSLHSKKILFEVHDRLAKQGDVGPVQYSLTTGITKEAKHCIHMWGPTRSKTILEDPGTVGFSWAIYLVDHYSGGILQLTPGSDPWPLILEPRVLLYCFFPVCSSNSTPGPNG